MANYDISKYIAYFNGDWVPYSEVKIDPLDRGFFLGDSVFEVERTFNGKSFKMREHIERLYRSLSFARIELVDCQIHPQSCLSVRKARRPHLADRQDPQ